MRAWMVGALSALVLSGPASAADLFFLGAWRIASAQPGPWATPEELSDTASMTARIGKTLTFEAAKIRGPGLLACGALQYSFVDSPPEGLSKAPSMK